MFARSEYIPISKDYLVCSEKFLAFDVYSCRSSNFQELPILLLGKDSSVENVKDVIANSHFGNLFIKKNDVNAFQGYLEDSIVDVLTSKEVPLARKSKIVYECAQNVMSDVFENPRSGENLARVKKITKNIIKFSLHDKKSIPALLNLCSHDYYTFTHCINVGVFGIGMWQALGRKVDGELYDFALGCMLHDIGKSKVPREILQKPGPLNEEELAEVRNHPQYGYDLMEGMLPERSLQVILHHHERFEGGGYPHAMSGDEIPEAVRIATIADVYDALTTIRPYAGAQRPFDAVSLMTEGMVDHFDKEKIISFIHFLGGRR